MLPTTKAAGELNPVFRGAKQAIQGQSPVIAELYTALVNGLQHQQTNQVQNVVDSAARRGVSRAGLQGDVDAMLGEQLALATGQLGVQQAEDEAARQSMAGQVDVSRGASIVDLAKTLLEGTQQKKRSNMEIQQMDRQYQLDSQEVQRGFEVAQAAEARRQSARSSASEGSMTTSQALLAINQLWQPGKDGYVNPRQWNELRKAFMEAGFSGSSFDSEFGSFINPEHQYRDSKLPRYRGVAIKDE